MNHRPEMRTVLYWSIQTAVVICVMLTTCFSLKNLLHADEPGAGLVERNNRTQVQTSAMAGIIPSIINAEDGQCSGGKYWTIKGITSNSITLRGAVCHYLLLTLCFWLMCYVVNTYLLIVRNKNYIFDSAKKLHAAQLLFCSFTPLAFVGICLLAAQPGYGMPFEDRLAILPSSRILVFSTITIPVQLCFGVSLCMLISVIREIRKASHNSLTATQVIRSEEEIASLRNVERHFVVIVFIYVFSMILIFIAEAFLQDKEITYLRDVREYFKCLQTVAECTKPYRPKFFLSNLKILTPGVFCLVSFILLFVTNKTRAVWLKWLRNVRNQMSKLAKWFVALRECETPFRRRHYSIRPADRHRQASVITLSLGSIPTLNIMQDWHDSSARESKTGNIGQ